MYFIILLNLGLKTFLFFFQNRQFVFATKIQYELVAERSEANLQNLQFPYWCSILELVRTHFSEKIPNLRRSRTDQNRQRARKNNRLEPCFRRKKKRKVFNPRIQGFRPRNSRDAG